MAAIAPNAGIARQTFEAENNVLQLDSADELFRYDEAAQRQVDSLKPWRSDPRYFKHVRISALALVKMTMHCRSGGNLEVMGMMQGKVQGDTFIVLDSFALPVEGTETRVNAGNEANEYMVEVVEKAKSIGRKENLVGWYHSHPGYGCWMSGIDCSTQMLNQQYQEPWLAVIIDPVRTCSAGKVDIGAFRTYPEGYKPPQSQDGGGEYQPIPLHKIEDFGVHAEQYYTLDVSIFKSSTDAALLDNLWNTYWVHTLSSSPLTTNRGFVAGQLSDVAAKLEQAGESAASVASGGGMGGQRGVLARKGAESSLTKVARDASTAALEQAKGMVSHLVKDALFNASSASGLHVSVGGDAVMQDADAVA